MTKKVTLTLALFVSFLVVELKAQNVYFSGLGRALVTNDQLADKTNDTSKLKSSGGYTLFDLGIYAKPNEVLRGGVILRVKNEFGGFYGDGAKLEFRQMQLEGLIAKKVKYEIGDIYLTHTPYTLWNGDSVDYKYEANLFSMRRDIINYENFYVGNAWRMQGFNTKAKINFSKGIQNIGIRVYGGRTLETDFTTIPDRYFYGGRIELVQSKFIKVGGNLAGITDIAGTVEDAAVDYDNSVITGDIGLTFDKSDKIKIALNAEAGSSKFQLKRAIDTSNYKFEDFFYDFGLNATYKPINLTMGLSYRDVGFNFNSPMAQSRRMSGPNTIGIQTFPIMNDGTTLRPISLFDPYAQEGNMYNQSISTTLMNYYVQYNMVEPYGRATPNRKGLTLNMNFNDNKEIVKVGFEANLLSEIVSEGDSVTQEKRDFTLLRGGFVFNVNKLLNFKKAIAINTGIRMEHSKREGTNPVDLSSSLIDLGLDIEVIKDLHLLGGTKLFKVNGYEVQTGRDVLNQIVSYGPGVTFNQTNSIIAAGLKSEYDRTGYFSVHYHIVNYDDLVIPTNKYKLNQWFFVFGLKF